MKKWMVLITLSMSMFIIVVDTTTMNVSISALIEGLDTSVGGIQAAIALYALAMATFMLLFSWEQQLEEKGGGGLFKPSIFKTPGLIPGFAVRFVQMGTTAASLFTMPLLFQLSFEFTAMQTGRALIPFSAGLLVFAIVGARLSSRFSARRIIHFGFLLAIAGLVKTIRLPKRKLVET
jgi:MFS family permease